jgi:2-amino-4-hydroxy-6-hydroxymethyldihydropteridine diphosphokinase
MTRAVLIGLGSNRGDKKANLQRALFEIEKRKLGCVALKSSLWRTEPKGMADEEDFFNAAVLLETELSAEELLKELLAIEQARGRVRGPGSGPEPRTLDLDILFFGNEIIERPGLHVPHPRVHERRFTLAPLSEIAPDFVHPLLKKTLGALLGELTDRSRVERLEESW